MEKINLSSIPQIIFHNMKTFFPSCKHTLFYLWLKYETIWNIYIIIMWFFFDKITLVDIIPNLCLSTFKQPLVIKIIIISYHIDPNLHFYLMKQ
jgi:hypothetical protein